MMTPTRKLAVITCMDALLDPAKFLGLQEGDAHVIRNAGGRAADAIRSLVISQHLFGTHEVVVVHHTDCGMLNFTDDQLHAKIANDLGVQTDIEFYSFADLEQSVRDDVAIIRSSPLLIKDTLVSGFVYDAPSGRLDQVV
jgi:carbonic anhydrase